MKKILALILSLVMVFGLAACGASTETPATTPTESGTTTGSDSTVEPIVLKFSDCHNPTATNHLAPLRSRSTPPPSSATSAPARKPSR